MRAHEFLGSHTKSYNDLNELAPNDPSDNGDDNDDGSMQAEFTVFIKGRPVTGTVVVYPGETTDVEYYLNNKVYSKNNMQNVDNLDDFIENAAGYIQEIAQLKGDGHHFVEPGQLNELMFMGMSPCTKDCSGHRAGYKWSKARGGVSTASWSNSFNKGAEIAKAGY